MRPRRLKVEFYDQEGVRHSIAIDGPVTQEKVARRSGHQLNKVQYSSHFLLRHRAVDRDGVSHPFLVVEFYLQSAWSHLGPSRKTVGFTVRSSHVEKVHSSLFMRCVNILNCYSCHLPPAPVEMKRSSKVFTGSEAVPGQDRETDHRMRLCLE